jgi:hypothetical protein
MMDKEDKKTVLKMQKAYEKYVHETLDIVRKKLDLIIDFRVTLGKKKLKNLQKTMEET